MNPRTNFVCKVDGCGRSAVARQLCHKHWQQWRKTADSSEVNTPGSPLADRFWRYVDQRGDCWFWTGGKTGCGYGVFSVNRRAVLAHRFAYEMLVGPIEAPQLDHLCRNPSCVNPAHLEPASARTNTLRGVGPSAINAQKTHCVNGHAFTPENTWVYRGGKAHRHGARHCRECMRESWRRWHERKRSA